MKIRLIFLALVFALILTYQVSASRDLDISKVKRISEDVYDHGEKIYKGQKVHGYTFIHKKEQLQKKEQLAVTTQASAASTCYSFTPGVRWKSTEQYVLDTKNSRGLSDSFVSNTILTSMNTWDTRVSFDVFGTRNTAQKVDGADTSAPDGKNEIYFGSISSPGAIASTTIWGVFTGSPSTNKIVEFDLVFDQVDYNWGNAQSGKMDLQNIATHEFGHALGLKHTSCKEETMYPSTTYGETKKRSLNSGDIAGLTKLYS